MFGRWTSCQRFVLLFCAVAFLFTTACRQQSPDTRATDEAAIRQADADWAKAAASKNIDATVAFYSDDAIVAPPNSPVATDKKSIRDLWAALLSPDLVSITWEPTRIEVARSGDLAYLNGWYKMTMKDAKGKPITRARWSRSGRNNPTANGSACPTSSIPISQPCPHPPPPASKLTSLSTPIPPTRKKAPSSESAFHSS